MSCSFDWEWLGILDEWESNEKLRIQQQQDKTGGKGFKGRHLEFERHSDSGYENSGQKAKRVQASTCCDSFKKGPVSELVILVLIKVQTDCPYIVACMLLVNVSSGGGMADSSQSPIQEEPGVKITFHMIQQLASIDYDATIMIQIGSFDVRGVICLRAVTAVCSSHTYRWSLSW